MGSNNRCFGLATSKQPGLAPIHPVILSLSRLESYLMLSIHLCFGLPKKVPSLPCHFLTLLPYILLLFSWHVRTNNPALSWIFLVVPLILSILIHLNILISATSNFFTCTFFTAHVIHTVITFSICDPSVQNQSHVAENINWVFHMCRKRRRWALIWCKKHLCVTIS